MPVELRRLAAFTLDSAGGNPACVWIGEHLPEPAEMQRIAAEVGDSIPGRALVRARDAGLYGCRCRRSPRWLGASIDHES